MEKPKIIKNFSIGILSDIRSNVLLVQRNDTDILAAHLKWKFPGGTHEFGETLEQTVERGFKEETGLVVKTLWQYPKSISYIWEHKDYTLNSLIFCYYCVYVSGEIAKKDSKVERIEWAPKHQLKSYDILESIKPLLPYLEFEHW